MNITLWQNLSNRAQQMASSAFKDVRTLDAWQHARPQIHQQFMHSLGLDPLPDKCDLNLRDYGTFAGEGFNARNIAFQILPDCWSSAAIYYPDPLPKERAPGVLYVCGHAPIGTYHYQYHPIMWARRGYICLIVDTIEQNDSPGEHHAGHVGQIERWWSLGYSAAGGETWNTIRALDVLAADPHVDPDRLAATGVSGGGALSFYIAAIDKRIKAVSTLCGVSPAVDAITNRHVLGHCDCLYPHNLYQCDISEYAALIAPRAAMFCFADHDTLFHPDQTRAMVDRARHVYQLYGKNEHCELVTCPGQHGDHPEFDEATTRWFDQHVAGAPHPRVERGKKELAESVTSVFHGQPPQPNRMSLLPELLSPRNVPMLPQEPNEWPDIRSKALAQFQARTNVTPARNDEQVRLTLGGDWAHDSPSPLRSYRGHIEGVEVWMETIAPRDHAPKLVMGIANDDETYTHVLARMRCAMDRNTAACAGFEPRLAGFSSPAGGTAPSPPGSWPMSMRTMYLRAMAIAGLTPVTMTMHDIAIAVDSLIDFEEAAGCDLYLYGRGDAGVAALYHSLFDDRIAGVILEDIPNSHLNASPILGVCQAFDMPHAVGLMAPRKVTLITPGHDNWTWPTRVYERLARSEQFTMSTNLRHAFETTLA